MRTTCTRNEENMGKFKRLLMIIDFGVGTEIGFGVMVTNHRKIFELGDEKILKKNIFFASNLFW